MAFDSYRTHLPGWATSIELVNSAAGPAETAVELELEQPPSFLIATLTLLNAEPLHGESGYLRLSDRSRDWNEPRDDEHDYVDERGTLYALNHPDSDRWRVVVALPDSLPVAVNVMAFHPSYRAGPPALPLASRLRCRGCKITAKALALAIVAAATLPAIPAALIAAVATYLGVGAIVAAAFIGSVIGDTADIIAEKLCRRVGLC